MSDITTIEVVNAEGEPLNPVTATVTVVGTVAAGPPGSAAVNDGDKGDVVVSGSGTVWTIDTGAVTPAKLSFDPATQAELDAEAALARNADNLTSGTVADARIASTIARDSEVSAAVAASEAGQVRDGDAAGGVLGGTYPNPSFAVDMATQAELDAVSGAIPSTEAIQDLVGAMLTDSATVDFTYDDTAGTFTAVVQGLTSGSLSDFAEAVRDRLGATLVAGTGITVTVDDPGDTVTIATTVTQYTDEMARDAIGAALVAGNNIDITVDDVGNTITVDVEALTSADLSDFATAVDERARDALGSALVAGTNITITPDDVANTITIDAAGGGGSGVVESVVAGSNIDVDATDPANPVVSVEALTSADLSDFNEAAQDAVGTILADSATIDFTYTDATPEITADVKDGSITAAKVAADVATQAELDAVAGTIPNTEAIQDIVGGMVTGGTETGIAVTYDDTNARLDFVAEVTQAELDAVEDGLVTAISDGDASTLTSANAHSDALVSDTAYNSGTWDAVTGIAPSKNAVRDKVEALDTAKANLASPTFTGTVTLPSDQALPGNPTTTTQAQGNSSTRVATTAYVQTEVGLLVPKALFDANTMLYATTDNTPAALTIAASRIVGRKATGDISALTGAEAGDIIGVYQAYTPTIAQNGTRTTSAIAGRYMQVGKWVHCYGNATISNTGTAGQVLTVTVPVSASGGFGHGLFYDASTTSQYPGTMIFQSGTTIGLYVTSTTGNSAVGANPNVAVATGDALFWNVTYEAA